MTLNLNFEYLSYIKREPRWRNRLARRTYRQYRLWYAEAVSSSLTQGTHFYTANGKWCYSYFWRVRMNKVDNKTDLVRDDHLIMY